MIDSDKENKNVLDILNFFVVLSCCSIGMIFKTYIVKFITLFLNCQLPAIRIIPNYSGKNAFQYFFKAVLIIMGSRRIIMGNTIIIMD